MGRVRTHPVVGSLFILSGLALFSLGALARDAPAFLKGLPIPPEVIMPFIFWQLATWAILFGVFFLRPRGRQARGRFGRALPRI